jgi:hypothetical protein
MRDPIRPVLFILLFVLSPISGLAAGTKHRYLVRKADVVPYSPAHHTGTKNYRLISPETVGSKHVEMLLGEIEGGKGALPYGEDLKKEFKGVPDAAPSR